MNASVEGMDLRRLRLSLMSLAGPPQAQRHHARVGLLQQSCVTIAGIAARPAGAGIDARQAAALAAVADRLAGLELGWQERIPPDAGKLGYDFLLGNAFEDTEWEALRLTARAAFTVMRAPESPLVG